MATLSNRYSGRIGSADCVRNLTKTVTYSLLVSIGKHLKIKSAILFFVVSTCVCFIVLLSFYLFSMPSKQCVVVDCTTSYSDTITIRHRFPKDKNIFKIWVMRSGNNKLVNLSMADVHKSFVMCDKHFAPSCKSPGFKKLILNSVPTLNLPGNNNYDYTCLYDL